MIEIERFSIFGAVTNIDLILMGCGGVWGLGGDQLAQSAVGRPDAFAEGSEHGFPWGGKIELRGWKEGGRDWAVIAAVFTPNIIPKWLPKAREKRTERKRPCALEPHCWANVLPPDQYSFPSGHSTTAFAIVVPLSLYYPHLTDVLVFLAMSIAVSRILLEMHFLSDVIAGGLPGAGLGYSSYRIFCVFS